MRWDRVGIILVLLFGAGCIVMILAGNWSVGLFGLTYVLAYGGPIYVFRKPLRSLLKRLPGPAVVKFFGLAMLVSALEEVWCYMTGNQVALPVLWEDVVFCSTGWLGWYGTWYFFLSKRYRFEENEALILAGLTGLFYELAGKSVILSNPLGVILFAPVLIMVYVALFLLPMQLIELTGTRESLWKYPVAVIVPYLLSIPLALIVFLIFSLAGLPLK